MIMPPYVLDSSVWVEFFLGNDAVRNLIIDRLRANEIIVPSVCAFEVALAVERRIDAEAARLVAANMREQHVDALTVDRALQAASIRREYKLAMADSIVYATALAHHATLITQDIDFEGLPDVMYLRPQR